MRLLIVSNRLPITVIKEGGSLQFQESVGEIEVSQVTGYSKSQLFLNGINKGDRVIVVDDVISTGGTLLAVLKSLKVAGAIVKDIVVVVQRGDGVERLSAEGYQVKTMVDVEVDENQVTKVTESDNDQNDRK